MGAADAPGRLPIKSIIVGFGIFFNHAFRAWGIYQPVSTERGQPFARLPLWVAILLYHLKTEIEALNMFLLVGLKFSLYYPFCASLLVVP